jgi:hypothetical protein
MRNMFFGFIIAVLLAHPAGTGMASEERCIPCLQSYGYICSDNFGQCMKTCYVIATSDRYGCKRQCMATSDACDRRAAATCGTCKPVNIPQPPPWWIE